ncbi:glycine zipper 2TM domain-containing protein [Sedimenticola hydrogenitrophicus]|uniref:glycine zipper 2TM domain-containing protein n=1 Tax=Sedimenticola hydrogenitrophicus TaxID=2967975 RepID=UPI0021A7E071|nr:glycine zipper 2TM domain-containing protein [Sedimenticola hydrogenitrophicus]
MKTCQIVIAAIVAVTALVGGCTNTGYRPVESASTYSSNLYGVIEAIEVTSGDGVDGIAGTGIGAGAVVGGVVGGVLGHQVGGGSGQDIATAVGVVGGAVVGHEIQKRSQQQPETYRLQVRLENGSYRAVMQDSIEGLRVGDRVRIDNGRAYRY